jgi:predicted small lipoprotein YifL
MSAIVAALAVASVTLSGCGQRGPLYLPVAPPLPPKPSDLTEPPASGVQSGADTTSSATAGTSLSLSPASELRLPSDASKSNASAASAASNAASDQ